MSYKLIDVELKKLTNKPNIINFEVDKNDLCYLLTDDDELSKYFINILNGYYLINNGKFIVDDEIDKTWLHKKSIKVKKNKFLFSLITKELFFYFSVLKDPKKYIEYKKKYFYNKYTYLNYKASKNNLNELKLKSEIEEKITDLINKTNNIEIEILQKYFNNANNFNQERINDFLVNEDYEIKEILKKYFYVFEEVKKERLELIFKESLWDKIFSLIDLQNTCFCEYKIKKTGTKEQKKNIKNLQSLEIYYIIKRELAIIGMDVFSLKYSIKKNDAKLKSLKRDVFNKLNKKRKKEIKKISDLCPWILLNEQKRKIFNKEQEQLIFKGLTDDFLIFKNTIIKMIHEYHKQILNKEITYGLNSNFENYKRLLYGNIKSVYQQTQEEVNTIIAKLEINFKNTLLSPFLYLVYIKSIQLFLSSKKNLIINLTNQNLSNDNSNKMFTLFKNSLNSKQDKSLIIIDKHIKNIWINNQNIYKLNKYEIKKIKLDNYLNENLDNIEKIFKNINKVNYKIEKDNIYLMDKKINSDLELNISNNGSFYINPYKLYDDKSHFEQKNYVKIKLRIINFSEYSEHMYYGVNKDNYNFVFYSKQNYEIGDNVSVYFNKDSIFKFIEGKK